MTAALQAPEITAETCEHHGEYMPRTLPHPINKGEFLYFKRCPACEEEENQRQAERDREQERLDTERRKREAGLRARHIACRLENYEATTEAQKQALGKVREFLSNVLGRKGGNLVLAGRVGTGKTHLAAALVSRMVEEKRSCKLIKMPELIRTIKTSWGDKEGPNEAQLISMFSRLDLLVIDEVGIQFGSDTEKLFISEIIDNRYQDLLPTVLISNLDITGIRNCIGERCYDRLKEDGGKVVAFDWGSARGTAA